MSVYFVRFLSHEWGGDAARVALVAEMQPMCTTSCTCMSIILEEDIMMM